MTARRLQDRANRNRLPDEDTHIPAALGSQPFRDAGQVLHALLNAFPYGPDIAVRKTSIRAPQRSASSITRNTTAAARADPSSGTRIRRASILVSGVERQRCRISLAIVK